jgi:hypothetical protein
LSTNIKPASKQECWYIGYLSPSNSAYLDIRTFWIFFIFLLISVLYLNLIFQLFGIILQKYKCISGETFLGGICFHVEAFLIFWNTFPLMMAEKTAEMSWQMEYSIFIVKYNKRFYLYVSSSDNKSVSHRIMFDYFFHVWKVNIFF